MCTGFHTPARNRYRNILLNFKCQITSVDLLTLHHCSPRLTTKSSSQQEKCKYRTKQSTVTRQSSSKLHTNWLIELRPFVDDNLRQKAESMPVCPLLCSLRNPYSRQGPHTTKKAHKCTFSVRGGFFSPSSKPSPHRNSPHRNIVPEAKVLTGVAQ